MKKRRRRRRRGFAPHAGLVCLVVNGLELPLYTVTELFSCWCQNMWTFHTCAPAVRLTPPGSLTVTIAQTHVQHVLVIQLKVRFIICVFVRFCLKRAQRLQTDDQLHLQFLLWLISLLLQCPAGERTQTRIQCPWAMMDIKQALGLLPPSPLCPSASLNSINCIFLSSSPLAWLFPYNWVSRSATDYQKEGAQAGMLEGQR